jgi:hypothetical protein
MMVVPGLFLGMQLSESRKMSLDKQQPSGAVQGV